MFTTKLKPLFMIPILAFAAFGQDKPAAGKGTYDSFRNQTSVKSLLASKSYPIGKDDMLIYDLSPKLDSWMIVLSAVAVHEGQEPKRGGLKSLGLEVQMINIPSLSSGSAKVPAYFVVGTQRFELSGTMNALPLISGPRGTQMSVGGGRDH